MFSTDAALFYAEDYNGSMSHYGCTGGAGSNEALYFAAPSRSNSDMC